MFYTIQNGSLLMAEKEENLTSFYDNVLPLPDDYEEGKYIVLDDELVLNPNFEDEQAQKRKEEFKSQFFEIVNVGFYRRTPKGYASALESVNTAFNAVSIMGNLPANTLTFYKEPDYSDPTQCTEEWLVENSFKNEEMTTAEFGQFYASFITAWNTQEHL